MEAEIRNAQQVLAKSARIKFQVFEDQLLHFSPKPTTRFVVDAAAVRLTDHTHYSHLVHDTVDSRGWAHGWSGAFQLPAGNEAYRLLAYLSKQAPGSVIIDLGSYYGLSALAMGSELSNTVISFDVEDRESLIAGYNNMTVAQLKLAAPNVHFRRANALQQMGLLLSAPLIYLDTAHYPETMPFEYEMIAALTELHYTGIVVVDGKHHSPNYLSAVSHACPSLPLIRSIRQRRNDPLLAVHQSDQV
jgi:predicted O-methyltransferase YrrM